MSPYFQHYDLLILAPGAIALYKVGLLSRVDRWLLESGSVFLMLPLYHFIWMNLLPNSSFNFYATLLGIYSIWLTYKGLTIEANPKVDSCMHDILT